MSRASYAVAGLRTYSQGPPECGPEVAVNKYRGLAEGLADGLVEDVEAAVYTEVDEDALEERRRQNHTTSLCITPEVSEVVSEGPPTPPPRLSVSEASVEASRPPLCLPGLLEDGLVGGRLAVQHASQRSPRTIPASPSRKRLAEKPGTSPPPTPDQDLEPRAQQERARALAPAVPEVVVECAFRFPVPTRKGRADPAVPVPPQERPASATASGSRLGAVILEEDEDEVEEDEGTQGDDDSNALYSDVIEDEDLYVTVPSEWDGEESFCSSESRSRSDTWSGATECGRSVTPVPVRPHRQPAQVIVIREANNSCARIGVEEAPPPRRPPDELPDERRVPRLSLRLPCCLTGAGRLTKPEATPKSTLGPTAKTTTTSGSPGHRMVALALLMFTFLVSLLLVSLAGMLRRQAEQEVTTVENYEYEATTSSLKVLQNTSQALKIQC